MFLPLKLSTNWLGRRVCAQLKHLPKCWWPLRKTNQGLTPVKIFLWAALFTYFKKWWKLLTYTNICYWWTSQAKMRQKTHSLCLLQRCCVTAGTSTPSLKCRESNTKSWCCLIAQRQWGVWTHEKCKINHQSHCLEGQRERHGGGTALADLLHPCLTSICWAARWSFTCVLSLLSLWGHANEAMFCLTRKCPASCKSASLGLVLSAQH